MIPLIPLIPMLTRAGAMLLAKKYAKDKLRKKILKDAALKKKVDKIGKKALKKETKENPTKRKARKKILTDKSVRKRAKKIGQKATKQEATPPFAKSKSSMADWGYAIRRHKSFNPADTPLKKALGEHKGIEAEKLLARFTKARISKRMLARKPGQPGKGKPRSRRRKDVTELDRRSLKRTHDRIKAAEDKKRTIIKKRTKELTQKKRERDLKKDSEQRRN